VTDLARALLDEIAADPAALAQLRELMAVPVPEPAQGVVSVPALLTVAATAKVLGVSPDTLRRRIAEGAVPAVTDHGRTMVRADDLRSYIDGLERIGQRPGRARRVQARRRYDFLHDGRSPS
jgi:excisionase family DNA binding protein